MQDVAVYSEPFQELCDLLIFVNPDVALVAAGFSLPAAGFLVATSAPEDCSIALRRVRIALPNVSGR
jgi:hypothetical protein